MPAPQPERSGAPPTSSEPDPTRVDRKLSEVAKKLVVPADIEGSYWPGVKQTCTERLGLTLDRWQDGIGGLALAYRADGALAHTVGGFGMSLPRQVGKPLAIDTPVLTSNNGWVANGDLVVGDEVFHPDGHAVRVAEVHPIMYDHVCYEVTTTDGRTLVADAEHLWTVTDKRKEYRENGKRLFRERTLTTQEMLDEGLSRYAAGSRSSTTDGKKYQTDEYRFILPRQECLQDLPEQDLLADPYLLGAWLGNGASSGAQLTMGEQDIDHWREVFDASPFPATYRYVEGRLGSGWTVGVPGGFLAQLRELGVLNDKHIPEQYLIGSTSQRLAMLQGLLDTDGHITSQHGTIEFCSMTKNLADGALFLARSLGWRATLSEGKATLDGRDYGIKYRVTFTPKLADEHTPFRLQRKIDRITSTDGGKGRHTVSIKSIERVATRPVRCIKVDSEDGLFLAGRDLVATHNTFTLTALMFGLCVETEGLLIIWTSHHVKTNSETFQAVQSYCKRERIKPFIKKVYLGSGDEAVEFINGSRILFGARERGFGRGIPGVDVLMSDEAQILTQRAMQDMLATLNTSRLGLHIYCGTPPKPTDNSEMFTVMRQEATSGEATDMVWIEVGADNIDDLDDIDQWLRANPSCPQRTPVVSIQRLRRRLDDAGFQREALGFWDADEQSSFDIAAWSDLAEVSADTPGRAALVVDMSPDRRHCWIGVAGDTGTEKGERVLLMAAETTAAGAVAAVQKLMESRDIVEVAITSGAARSLEPALVEANVEYVRLAQTDVAAAYATMQEAIKNKTICHLDQNELNTAMLMTRTRFVTSGESEVFDRKNYSVNLSPAVACACALFRWGMAAKPLPVLM